MLITSERKVKAERSSETGPAIAMNLLFLISFSNVILSFRDVNSLPPRLLLGLEEEGLLLAVTIALLILVEPGKQIGITDVEIRRRQW